MRFVNCAGRAPSAGGQDFIPSIVDTMYSQRVLLEIWGGLDMQVSAGGARQPLAEMRYLLVPMKVAADRNEPASSPLQRLTYSTPAAASAAPDFVSLIARRKDVDAFVAAALGSKSLSEKSFDLAHRNLCYAASQLQGVQQRSRAGRERDEIAAMRGFVLASAKRAVEASQPAAPASGRPSLLALQDANDPCSSSAQP